MLWVESLMVLMGRNAAAPPRANLDAARHAGCLSVDLTSHVSLRRTLTVLAVSEYNEIARLDSLRRLWRSLWERTRDRSFFQSLEWLETYWRHFGVDSKLRVLMVSVGGRPIGIVPLVVKTTMTPLGTMRVLTDPLDDWGTFYRSIGPHPAITLKAAVEYLRTSRRDWDVIDLRHIDANGADNGRLRNALRSSRMSVQSSVDYALPVIEIEGTFNEYLSRLTSDEERVLHDSERVLSASGRVSYRRFRPTPSVRHDDAFGRMMLDDFEKLTISGRGCPARLGVERQLIVHFDCLRELHDVASSAGVTDLNLLYLDETPVAGIYGYHCAGATEVVQAVGVDCVMPEAGSVLVSRMLRDSFERQDRRLLFNTATSALADRFHASGVPSHRYTHFAATAPRAQLLRARCSLRSWLGEDSRALDARSAPATKRSEPIGTTVDAETEPPALQTDDEPHRLRIYPASV